MRTAQQWREEQNERGPVTMGVDYFIRAILADMEELERRNRILLGIEETLNGMVGEYVEAVATIRLALRGVV